jgi:cbb3-type cytochrome oxidase subunit 3
MRLNKELKQVKNNLHYFEFSPSSLCFLYSPLTPLTTIPILMNIQTPLSFIAALFSIPSQQYPYNGNIDWKLWHIAVGMCMFSHSLSTLENMHGGLIHLVVPELLTFLIVLIYWVYIRRGQKKAKDKLQNFDLQDDNSQDDNPQDGNSQDETNSTSSGKHKLSQNWWQNISEAFRNNKDSPIPNRNPTSTEKQKWGQNWWQKISNTFRINEHSTIPGNIAAGAMSLETSQRSIWTRSNPECGLDL